jgi:hypothetical protein
VVSVTDPYGRILGFRKNKKQLLIVLITDSGNGEMHPVYNSKDANSSPSEP